MVRHRLKKYRQHMPVSPPLQGRMFDILMDTTSACQLRCVMCPQSLPRQSSCADVMDERTIRRVAEQVLPHAASLALSCMAEPMMNPHFSLLLELLEGSGLTATSMVTNGMYMPDPIVERIIRARIEMVTFSLDSPVAEEYEAIRVGARLPRVISTIRRLREKRDQAGSVWPVIKINCVLMHRNIRSLPQLVELAAELGAGVIDLRHVLPFDGLDTQRQSLIDDPELAHHYMDLAQAKADELGVVLNAAPRFHAAKTRGVKAEVKHRIKRIVLGHYALPRCSQPWKQLVIHPNGELYPCTNWIYDPSSAGPQLFCPPVNEVTTSPREYCLGNLRDQSFEDIFNGQTWRRLREEMMGRHPLKEVCQHCNMRLSQGGQLYDPESERVNYARRWGNAHAAAQLETKDLSD